MLSPSDIRRLCERRYPSFLKAIATGEPFFPLRVPFGRPSPTDEWAKLDIEITALARADLGARIEWEEINSRRWGRQRFPIEVAFDTETEYLALLGRSAEVQLFRQNVQYTLERLPRLSPWVPPNVMRLVQFGRQWRELLMVCEYFLAYPRPAVYARELPLPVDTKFIERNEGILRLLLDAVLPDSARTESPQFESRFGLRYEEPSVRFRILDPEVKKLLSLPVDDLAVPLSQFQALCIPSARVIVVENKMTFLTLPALASGIGVFGGGVAAELLASVSWLRACQIFYWGDLDVHGFHILARLRCSLPHLTSLMMTATTLDQFAAFITAARPSTHDLPGPLTADERVAYDRVKADNLLLEQERIPFTFAASTIREAWADPP